MAKNIPGELLIVPAAGVSDADVEAIVQSHGGKKSKHLRETNTHKIVVPAAKHDAVKDALEKDPRIETVEENILGTGERTVPNDPAFASQWHLPNIWAPAGWDVSTGSAGVIIAVIDSGIDLAHPDLKANIVPGYNCISNNTNTQDLQQHGTAVSGAAAAVGNNGIGCCGVTWRSKIMPLVVLNASNVATVADVSEAIIYAANNGAKVINLSLAYTTSSVTLTNAVNYAWGKGSVIVAAAANYNTSAKYYPAANTNVMAVGATGKDNAKTSWSNYGSWVDVTAPGIDIYTTKKGGGYWWCWGTSLSTPLVAGLAALVFSAKPTATNAEVVNLITQNCTDKRINVYKTLTAIV